MSPSLWPLVLYAVLVLVVVVSMLGLSYLLGERHQGRAKDSPFEAGILSSTPSRTRFSARFYLIAMFFLIFDLEAVFLYAWAVSARTLGWAGYFEVLVFVGVLLAGLVYLWRRGYLDGMTSGSTDIE